MPAEILQWGAPVLIADSGSVGGISHYFNEYAQELYLNQSGMATRLIRAPDGQYGPLMDELELNYANEFSGFALDHPSFGILFGSWVQDGALVAAIYVYAADIGEIISSAEIGEQPDNPQKELKLVVKNTRSDLFDHDLSLMQPGAGIELDLYMGTSGPYPMGRYYLDTGPYDPFADKFNFAGRSRVGRLLRETRFDLHDSDYEAVFTGTAKVIVETILQLYSDKAIEPPEILVQPDDGTYTARFPPDKGVLDGLTEWLRSYRTPAREDLPTIKRGDTGDNVRLAQTRLNDNAQPGAKPLVVDGIFGVKTEAATKDYQRSKGIRVDGIIGPDTWAALMGGQPGDAWEIIELYDGRIVVGGADYIAQYRPVSRYTMSKDTDLFTRRITRSADGAYSRVGIKYVIPHEDEDVKKEDEKTYNRYAYAVIPTWAAWAIPSHTTFYDDAPEGATEAQAQELADKYAVLYQYVGVTEQATGPIRPQLLVGDIAQIYDSDTEATVLGVITEVRHKMGETGFSTDITYTSGGAIMEREGEALTTWGRHLTGANRRERIYDVMLDAARKTAAKGNTGLI